MPIHPFLTKLGVPIAVQDFFSESYSTDKIGNLIFNYGVDAFEHFGFAFHLVPKAKELWVCGNSNFSRQVFICANAMEAISYVTINHHKITNLEKLTFIAIGTNVSMAEINWIKPKFRNRDFGFIFSKDILGQILDVKIALALYDLSVEISIIDETVNVMFKDKVFSFSQAKFSYLAFCKAVGFRARIRTYKSKTHCCFLEQLISNV
ncbi:MAG: hypothetical protein EON51_02080 [Acinetobacter sp.]|nr:MAG: hypothetical protein EON51_02080 [Acinetobacter sp.]